MSEFISINQYIKNIYDDFKNDYKCIFVKGVKYNSFLLEFEGKEYCIESNGSVIALCLGNDVLHHVPIMMSSTDKFFIGICRKLFLKKQYYTIFDFI